MPTSESVPARSSISIGRVRLREATDKDLVAIARIHKVAYSRDHFLVFFSEKLLADYYSRFLGRGSQIVLAVADSTAGPQSSDAELLGFAVFGRNVPEHIAEFKRDRRAAILGTALRHPLVAARKALSAVGRLLGRASAIPEARAVLLSIAVREGGKGVGRALLEDMFKRSAEAGEDRIGLWVRHRNVPAIEAYQRVGFRIVQSTKDQHYMERDLIAI